MVKNSKIEARVSEETKRKLLSKADALNLSLTNFLEKVANEPIIFVWQKFKKEKDYEK